jgi:hypothetical protein
VRKRDLLQAGLFVLSSGSVDYIVATGIALDFVKKLNTLFTPHPGRRAGGADRNARGRGVLSIKVVDERDTFCMRGD